jgi:hypothetical protein
VPDKPANGKCIGHLDQRKFACDPMRWYIQVNRRLVYMVPKDKDNLDLTGQLLTADEFYRFNGRIKEK